MKASKILIFIVVSLMTLSSFAQGEDLIPFEGEKGKCGYKNRKGEVVVKPIYDLVFDFHNGMACVGQVKKNANSYNNTNTYGYINENGELVIPIKYATACGFEKNGLARVAIGSEDKEKGGWKSKAYGVINKNNEIVVKFQYDYIYEFDEDNLAIARKKNNRFGIINTKGEVVVDFLYYDISNYSHNGLVIAKKNKKEGVMNKHGDIIVDFLYDLLFFDKDKIIAMKNSKYGVINDKGEIIVDFVYDFMNHYDDNGLLRVEKNSKWGFINEKGDVVIDLLYDNALEFEEGLCAVVSGKASNPNKKLGFVDNNGDTIMRFDTYDITLFYDKPNKPSYYYKGIHDAFEMFGYSIWLKKGGKWGLVSRDGFIIDDFQFADKPKRIIKYTFEGNNYPYPGFCVHYGHVIKNGKEVFVDESGNEYATEKEIEEVIGKYVAALSYYYDYYGSRYADALSIFRLLAESGNIESMWYCGHMYEEGLGVQRDVPKAIEWYNRASTYGHKKSIVRLTELKFGSIRVDPENQTKPVVEWPYIPSTFDQSQFVLKAEIKSVSKIEYCKLYLNGVEVQWDNASGGSAIVEDENHDITINRTLVLREGKNSIGIKVKNVGRETVEEKTIEYKPEKSISEKAVIVWNDLPTNTTVSQLKLDAMVKSKVKGVTCQVLLNGAEVAAPTKGSSIVEDSKELEYKYKVKVQRTLNLKENITNTIVIEVKDAQGRLLKSDQKQVTYTKPTLATIEWGAMPSTTDEKRFTLRAQIKSDSEIENYSVTLNGIRTKGSYIVKDNHDISIDEVFNLREGDNIVKIVVKNKAGEVGEEKTITYAPKEKRIALVIGNADYKSMRFPQLTKTKEDAQTMYALFKSYGFDMMPMVLDGDLKKMREAINDFIDEVGKGNYDVALLYYSGHGLSPDGGANYLIPVDAEINYTDEVKHNAINSKTDLLAKLEEKDCRVEILLLDCCNDCTLAERGTKGAYNGGLSPIRPSYGISVIHAALPGQKALEGAGKNSPFVESFVECSESHPNVGWETFVNDFIESVRIRTNEYQTPYAEGRILGKPFYINKSK